MNPRIGLRAILCAAASLALLGAGAGAVAAQQTGTVQGTVTDAATARPLPGAQVLVQGTQIGTLTNAQGRFQLVNVPAGAQTVRVELVGYTPGVRTVTVTAGQAATVNVTMEQTAIALQEIVVTTALGIERQSRELAYSVSTIGADDLTRARETNFVQALAGRTPGLEVIGQSGNIGGSSRVVIRGLSSL
jgi:hypothetical protein